MVKDYIDTNDFTKEELLGMVELAHRHEGAHQGGRRATRCLLKNKTLGMIFQQVSTRTRISFETAMTDLGGHAQFFGPGSIQLGGHESIEDSGRVMGSLVDILMARVDRHKDVVDLAKYSACPGYQRHERVQPPHPGARRPHDHDRESARGQEDRGLQSSPSSATPPRCACP